MQRVHHHGQNEELDHYYKITGHLSSICLSKVQKPFGIELIQLNSQGLSPSSTNHKIPNELTRRNCIRTEQTNDAHVIQPEIYP